jgi:hypothetical protein
MSMTDRARGKLAQPAHLTQAGFVVLVGQIGLTKTPFDWCAVDRTDQPI